MNRSTVIVVPCRNEACRLEPERYLTHVDDNPDTAFLFANDKSTDDTLDILQEMADARPVAVSIASLSEHRGKAEAVRRGVLAALSDSPRYVGYLDADLATPLESIDRLRRVLEARPHVSIALASRVRLLGREIRRRPVRHYLGRVFATAASLVLGIPVYDTQCGLKLLRVDPGTRRLFEHPFQSSWIFDVELLARFLAQPTPAGTLSAAERLYEVPLERWTDVGGSRLKTRDFVRAPFELLKISLSYDLRAQSHGGEE